MGKRATDHTDEIAWLEQLESLLLHGSDSALFAIDAGGTITAWRCDSQGAFGYGQDALVGHALASLLPDYEAPAIVETAHDAYVAIDADSVILEWNRQAELTFGWSRDEAIGLNLIDTILPPQWMDNFPALDLPRTDAATAHGLHGAFAFPVVDGDRVLGVVEFFSTRVEPPDEALLEMMHDIGRLLGRFITRNAPR